MANNYLPAIVIVPELLGKDFKVYNNQYLATARICQLFPAYNSTEDALWYYHVEAFKEFCRFCEEQANLAPQLKAAGDTLYFINQIRFGSESDDLEPLDFDCPFNLQQIGNLYMLNAVTGIILKRGINKHQKKIYASSYWALVKFRNRIKELYTTDLEIIGYQINKGKSIRTITNESDSSL